MESVKNTIWVVLGTRPEAIKQAPVYMRLVELVGKKNVSLVGTGQHEELLNQALAPFGLTLDLNLKVMGRGNDLCGTSGIILQEMGNYIKEFTPSCLIVQGDTSTAAMSGMAAFFNKVPVFHNEAGLRSYDIYNPFPEEVNRKVLTAIANVHFAPTQLSRDALIKEGVEAETIFITGNTGIDALMMVLQQVPSVATLNLLEKIKNSGRKPVLMTAHRRENAGQGMDDWMQSVSNYFKKNQDLALVFPLHPNNLARKSAEEKLGKLENCFMIDPLDYIDCCHVLNECQFVVTDSGGIQEEASTLGIPVVVCRKTTERMEAVHSQMAVLAGLQTETILKGMDWANEKSKKSERKTQNIFGDGKASQMIADLVLERVVINVEADVADMYEGINLNELIAAQQKSERQVNL